MNDTVDNQGADTLGFINGGEIFKRSWKVLNELVKSTKHFRKNARGNPKGNFVKHRLFLNVSKIFAVICFCFCSLKKKLRLAFWHRYNSV